jgi:Sec-independent protein translocase protein TatA
MGFLRGLGSTEIIIIIAILLLLFGGGLVKSAAKRAGATTKEIKKAKQEFEKAAKETPEDNQEA